MVIELKTNIFIILMKARIFQWKEKELYWTTKPNITTHYLQERHTENNTPVSWENRIK